MKNLSPVSLYIFVFAVLLPVFLTGCFAVYTDTPEKYGISYDKSGYASTDNFDGVFAMTETSGWGTETVAVVFDFKGDDITLEPWHQEWQVVRSNADLEKIMADVETDTLEAISIKPCDTCERKAAGVLFSGENIVFKFARENMKVSFYHTADAGYGAGGAGGAGAGGG